jgi:uncharacterized protein (DUF433 family)
LILPVFTAIAALARANRRHDATPPGDRQHSDVAPARGLRSVPGRHANFGAHHRKAIAQKYALFAHDWEFRLQDITVPVHAQAGGKHVGLGTHNAFLPPARHTGVVTADHPEMISIDPRVMHGQAVIAGTRVPVSVILDCLAAGMTVEEIIAYPTVTVAGVCAAAAYGAALAREELLQLPQSR